MPTIQAIVAFIVFGVFFLAVMGVCYAWGERLERYTVALHEQIRRGGNIELEEMDADAEDNRDGAAIPPPYAPLDPIQPIYGEDAAPVIPPPVCSLD